MKALLDYVENGLGHLDKLIESGDIEAALRHGEIFSNSAMSAVGSDLKTSRRALRLATLARSTSLLAERKRR